MLRSVASFLMCAHAATAQLFPAVDTMPQGAQVQAAIGEFVRERVPALRVPADARAWEAQATKLRAQFSSQVLYRNWPTPWRAGAVRVEWLDTIDTPHGYSIRKLRYQALPGLWIPALLYVPTGLTPEARVPGVLNVNGHVGDPGKAIAYEQIRCINLAKRGMLALHPEWFNFGDLKGPGYGHMELGYLDMAGVSGVGVFTIALERAVDLLLEYPGVDPDRIAMTGLSGGGWQTIFAAAADTRIHAIVPNAGYIGLAERTKYLSDVGDLEQIPPGLLTVLDYTHLTALLAPRPTLLIYNEKDECCFAAERALLSVYEPLVSFWNLYNAREQFQAHVNRDPGTHNYDLDNRRQFYKFMKRVFEPNAAWTDEELPSDTEVLTPEQLSVPLPEGNATFPSLALALLDARGPATLPAKTDPGFDASRAGQVAGLKSMLNYQPAAAEPESREEAVAGDYTGAFEVLRVDGRWLVPTLTLGGASPTNTSGPHAFVLADEGFEKARAKADTLLPLSAAVTVLEPLYFGSNRPATHADQTALLVNATGQGLLGLQVAQFAATVRHFGASGNAEVHTSGPNAAYVVLAAAALEPGLLAAVHTEDAPDTLRQFIQDRVSYKQAPALYTFDILRFDLPLLRAL